MDMTNDIRFLLHNKYETDEQFINELNQLFQQRHREAIAEFQISLIDDLAHSLRDSVVEAVVKHKRNLTTPQVQSQEQAPVEGTDEWVS